MNYLPLSIGVLLLAGSAVASIQSVQKVQTTGGKERVALKTPSPVQKEAEVSILSEKTVGNNIRLRTVRDKRGRVYRQIVRNGKSSKGFADRTERPKLEPSANASFYEGFEGWPEVINWIPEGWTEINTPENIPTEDMMNRNIDNTWHGDYTGDGYWTDITTDGQYECYIHFAYTIDYTDDDGNEIHIEKSPQDEWLISPEFHVKENQDLFFLAQVDVSSIYPLDWNTMEYDRSQLNGDLVVKISTDGGETWSDLWKASESIASKLSDDELKNILGDMKYRSISVSMSEYYGRDVKLAFEYINNFINGNSVNSMSIDGILVDAPQVKAGYDIPRGGMMAGFDREGYIFNGSMTILPPYRDVTWESGNNQYAETTTWTFLNPETGEMDLTFDTSDATMAVACTGQDAYPYPVIKAANAFSEDTYQFGAGDNPEGGIVYAGKFPKIETENGLNKVPFMNLDYVHKELLLHYFSEGNYVFGTCSDDTWGDYICTGFGNLFPAGAAPFTLKGVYVGLGEVDMDDDAEINVEVYTRDSYGYLGIEPVGTSKLTGAQINASKQDTWFWYPYFPLVDAEGNDLNYTTTEDLVVFVKGYNESDKIRKFACYGQGQNNTPDRNYAYVMLKGSGWEFEQAASDVLQDFSNALCIALDGSYNYLHADTTEYSFDTAGNALEITVEAGCDPDEWHVKDIAGESSLAAPVADGWLTLSAREDGNGRYILTAEAAATETDREMNVTIADASGNELTLLIRQPKTSGIAYIADADTHVYRRDGRIMVSGAMAGQQITVYTIDGRIAARAEADADGNVSFNMAGGVYLVKTGTRVNKIM